MRKILTLLALTFALAGCGGSGSKPAPATSAPTKTATVQQDGITQDTKPASPAECRMDREELWWAIEHNDVKYRNAIRDLLRTSGCNERR